MARVGDVEYATLPAALNAAEDGDTVTLLKDHTTDEENPSTVAAVKKRLTLASFPGELNVQRLAEV